MQIFNHPSNSSRMLINCKREDLQLCLSWFTTLMCVDRQLVNTSNCLVLWLCRHYSPEKWADSSYSAAVHEGMVLGGPLETTMVALAIAARTDVGRWNHFEIGRCAYEALVCWYVNQNMQEKAAMLMDFEYDVNQSNRNEP